MSAIIGVLAALILAGCSQINETETAANANANQMTTTNLDSDNTSVVPAANMTPNSDDTATDSSNNNMTTGGSNDQMQTAEKKNLNKDKKPSPPANMPTPVIGSGGQDFFLITQIRGALKADEKLADAVVVEIKEGNITLNGNVANEDQKKKAEQIVRGIKGVKSIKNNLRISS